MIENRLAVVSFSTAVIGFETFSPKAEYESPLRRKCLKDHFDREFWAGRYTVGKEKLDDGRRVSVRMNKPGPGGETSIPMADIVAWPFSLAIIPPDIDNMVKQPHPHAPTVG